ncbi:endo alpha-1,4 polygalactosaminidase [Lysinibacillus capsici]|uniref:endo alpha-1,4 polygalactosaminidase n=1 Tax=Lysinibacillus capsici TaxID=2115968 RepID=UPI002E1AB65D|nr:endo alpha-1,4 polygalactosaminidase [Lysinibacillus capsici]
MKKLLILLLALLIAGSMWMLLAKNSVSSSTSIQAKLADVKDYTYYLDKGNDAIGKSMTKLDLVIVEPLEMQQKYIVNAQKSGTLVYGYINVMEADKWNTALYQQLKEEDFYRDKQGERMYFAKWDSFLMDLTSTHYQDILLAEIEQQIVQKGLDGVFLDTVGNINSYLPEDEQKWQNEAMLSFIQQIKKRHPNISVAQNWGFQTLADYTATYVDFIMWEDFSYPVVGKDEWSLDMMQQLVHIRNKFGSQVMTIGFEEEAKSRALAEKHHFKFFYSPAGSYYNSWQSSLLPSDK